MASRLSSFLCLLLAACAFAAKPLGNQLCVGACYYALNNVLYAGANATDQKDCKNPLKVSSMYLCIKEHCDADVIPPGIDWWLGSCKKSSKVISLKGYEAATANVTLQSISSLPTVAFKEKPVVNTTAVPSKASWDIVSKSLYTFDEVHWYHYSIRWIPYAFWALVLLGGAANYAISFLPVEHLNALSGKKQSRLAKSKAWFNSNLLMSPTFTHHHHQTLGWFTIPLRLQSIIIVCYILIHVVLLSFHYPAFEGNTYYKTVEGQRLRIVSDKLGALMAGAMPFVFLFGGRGNILIFITGWSYRTFNIFHRWIAILLAVEGVIHGITFSAYYVVENGWSDYTSRLASDDTLLYGILAVISLTLSAGLAFAPLRKHLYELFKVCHIVLAGIFLAGFYYHVVVQSADTYIAWTWGCVGLWSGDYLLRWARLLLMSYKSLLGMSMPALASYSEETGMIRLQVHPSINSTRQTPGTHYYLYFPGWRVWESHPFTLAGRSAQPNDLPAYQSDQSSEKVAGAQSPRVVEVGSEQSEPYMTFMIRPRNGMTRRLRDKLIQKGSSGPLRTRVLLEGPYGSPARLGRFDNVLFIAGGSGITTVLPYLRMFFEDRVGAQFTPNVRLSWVARDEGFVRDVLGNDLRLTESSPLAASKLNMEFYVTAESPSTTSLEEKSGDPVGRGDPRFKRTRPDVENLVENFVSQSEGRVAVFVCGPAELADNTRMAVIKQTKKGEHEVELFEEMFCW